MIGIIAAVSRNGVIGKNGTIPWRYKGDLKRFKEVTAGSTVIMGRLTWESMGSKPLEGRRNIVVTSGPPIAEADTCGTVRGAIHVALEDDYGNGDVWLIGGSKIYEAGLWFADVIDRTWIPEHVDSVEGDHLALFPIFNSPPFYKESEVVHPYNDALTVQRWVRR